VNDLFTYMEYREYLRDHYEERKSLKSMFSLRYIARKVGMDDSYVSKILTAERHLPATKIPEFASLCGLKGRRADYFEALVLFGRARTDSERKPFLDTLIRLRAAKGHPLEAHQQKFYSSSRYTAIRAILGLQSWKDEWDEIGKRLDPSLKGPAVKEAIEFLLEVGLVERDEDGCLVPTKRHIRSGKPFDRAAIRTFQSEMLDLAKRSLEVHAPEARDFSTLTVAVQKETIEDIRQLVSECRDAIRKRIDQDVEPDTILHLNFQIFPLSRPPR
jgi:uncharacterized protein (TIGR02147 family)